MQARQPSQAAAGDAHAHDAADAGVFTRRLHARGYRCLQIGIATRTRQCIGALDGLEQFPGMGIVFDRHDGGPHDHQAPVRAPAVSAFNGIRQAIGKTQGVLLDAGDAIAFGRIVGVMAECRGQGAHHLVEQLVGGCVVQVGEIEHLASLQVTGGHKILHETDRIHDLQRVRAAGDGPHLGVQIAVVPVDFRLCAEPVVGQFFQRDKKGRLLRPWLPPKLEALPALANQ